MLVPSQSNIQTSRNIYEELEGWKQARRLIISYFQSHPSNDDELTVTIKTLLINGLYYTNIRAPLRVANHIVGLKNVNQELQAGVMTAVDRIARFDKFNLISFASKYAHFNNENVYPLYDQYVWKSLAYCWQEKRYQLIDYISFYNIMDSFRKLANLSNVSWADMDKYLWLLGLKKELDNRNTKISKEVSNYYLTPRGRALFESLEPRSMS